MRTTQQTHIIHSADRPRFTLFGALHQFLVSPDETSEAFAMIRMIVPPGGAIPLHGHTDPEVFSMLEGTLD
jgi:quercetin dioxygenase-like cupin family protein